MRKKDKNPLVLPLAALSALLLAALCLGSLKPKTEETPEAVRWQLEPKVPVLDVPSGFDGLAFTDDDVYAAHAAFFRLTKDSETGIQHAYVPAEMHPAVTGPLHLRLRKGESLQIRYADGAADADSSSDADSMADHFAQRSPDQEPADANRNAGEIAEEEKQVPCTCRLGDALPVFSEGEKYVFTVLDEDGAALGGETVVFHYTENVPSMYVETASGSMEAIDSDRHHETSEEASYRVYLTDGTPDSSGTCTIKGRGNSTWSQAKRPYNLNFEKENVILHMDSCRKYALVANFWDSTQTRQYYAFEAADRLGLAYTPQTRFVNLYLNGKYQSLYLLTQRINVNGGTVDITDLDKKNRRANPNVPKDEVGTVVMDTDEDGHEALAYDWQNEPADLTGGYLIEFENRYEKEDLWFATATRHMTFKAPAQPSVGEYEYISSYVREAEAALYAENGDSASDNIGPDSGSAAGSSKNESTGGAGSTENESTGGGAGSTENESAGGTTGSPEAVSPGGSVWDYFDMDSWARVYLIQDFFVQSDDEYYSFFFYKKAGDPLLYCGPVWDFDLCLGNMNCGDYYRTSAQTLWLRDGRKRWLHQMDRYPEFRARVAELYLEELEPIIRDLLENEYDQTMNLLETDTKLNYLRWHKDLDYHERTGLVKTLLETRVQFLHDYYTDPSAFHRLLFHFAWDDFSYYVRDGESMGFLPTYDYGEKQSSVQREANGFITGWQDTETGVSLQPDTPIYQDRDFDPVYIP